MFIQKFITASIFEPQQYNFTTFINISFVQVSKRNQVFWWNNNFENCHKDYESFTMLKSWVNFQDLTTVKRRKMQWYRHVSCSSGLAKIILQGTVKGGRRQGRQKKRWEGNFREWTGLEFTNSPEKNGGSWLWNWLWCPTTLAVKGQMIRWWMCYKRWSGMTQQLSNQSHLKEYHCWPSFARQFIEFTLHISAHATNSKTICLIITSYFVFLEERRRKVSGKKKKSKQV